ncbi:MAG TPA: fumarate hydratase, partial [Spirochaetota bacterium]|nr:fumarate hydratase [Spirochaetota bacterium]
SPLGKSILDQCIENARIAKDKSIGICQDTGVAVFFIEMGINVRIEGNSGLINDAVNEGVRRGYNDGYLRKSMLADPLFDRANTGDNTPAIIHLSLTQGDNLKITIAPKGGGAENMSALAMLPPAVGVDGVFRFVTESAIKAGGNPCPPIVIGVGIGGNFERCAYLAKKALTMPLGSHHHDPRYSELEKRILDTVNKSGIGPQGLGGTVTALSVRILDEPCHLASLPVAVNINCHVHRHETVIL